MNILHLKIYILIESQVKKKSYLCFNEVIPPFLRIPVTCFNFYHTYYYLTIILRITFIFKFLYEPFHFSESEDAAQRSTQPLTTSPQSGMNTVTYVRKNSCNTACTTHKDCHRLQQQYIQG